MKAKIHHPIPHRRCYHRHHYHRHLICCCRSNHGLRLRFSVSMPPDTHSINSHRFSSIHHWTNIITNVMLTMLSPTWNHLICANWIELHRNSKLKTTSNASHFFVYTKEMSSYVLLCPVRITAAKFLRNETKNGSSSRTLHTQTHTTRKIAFKLLINVNHQWNGKCTINWRWMEKLYRCILCKSVVGQLFVFSQSKWKWFWTSCFFFEIANQLLDIKMGRSTDRRLNHWNIYEHLLIL